ncbi:MAG: hypothetical protein J5861_00080 [Desulfovibrio sp.]|nr:hypothetical protein [Desulfovibrio sp.]
MDEVAHSQKGWTRRQLLEAMTFNATAIGGCVPHFSQSGKRFAPVDLALLDMEHYNGSFERSAKAATGSSWCLLMPCIGCTFVFDAQGT